MTAPLQKRVLHQNATVAYHLKTSLVPPVAVSAQMRTHCAASAAGPRLG